ncbi:hypothetical protein TSUD_322490 [Trifolium subterraneum]|uniref:Arabinogalactan peptide 14 n=1 Tax=Trifolium subterraneum TaxID=3900 RepID=A0A2Z6NPW9_TRISU|nr:hypothetical protein TSUD_322490 [Trifolium subterraneum]
MEASKMNFLVAVMVAMLMIAISGVSAAEAPAPSPASDATTLFVPTAFASLIALAFGFFF